MSNTKGSSESQLCDQADLKSKISNESNNTSMNHNSPNAQGQSDVNSLIQLQSFGKEEKCYKTHEIFQADNNLANMPNGDFENQQGSSDCVGFKNPDSERNLNIQSATKDKTKVVDTLVNVTEDLDNVISDTEAVGGGLVNCAAPAISDHQEKHQFPQSVGYQVNPNPDEFDLISENNLSGSKSNLDVSSEFMMDSDTSVVISNSNAFPQSEEIVPSNCSLSQLKAYLSDDESVNEEEPAVCQPYRDNDIFISDKDSESDSSSTSSSTSILISDSSDSDSEEEYENYSSQAAKPIKAKRELDIKDLPPIEELKISVPEENCEQVGRVFQIVDQLVVVQALKDTPALNLDTVLFIQGGQPLGKIFDVFGPVTEPYYCVRFNSNEQIKEKNINLNQMVYCAPKTKYTKFVFLAQLMKLKGSDASWEDDEEPPAIYLEYSDDEQEQRAKKKMSRSKKALMKTPSDPDEPARKKHFAYEKKMNERNLQLTAINLEYANNSRAPGFEIRPSTSRIPGLSRPTAKSSLFQEGSQQRFGRLPVFNISMPPPANHCPPPFRQNMPNILSPPPNYFTPRNPPNFNAHSPRGPNNNPGDQHWGPPPRAQRPPTYQGSCGPDQSWVPAFPNPDTPWVTSPTPSPNNSIPSSPFWVQRHPPPHSPNNHPPFTVFPSGPSPRPFWPATPPPPRPNNPPDFNFNPNHPPPPFNF